MPRAGLTRDRVAAVAADLADAGGLEALSLSAVAKQVGVSQPALYKHVAGLDALRRDVAVLAVRELAQVLATARAARPGREGLVGTADAYRAWAAGHPGRAAATVRAPAPGDAEHAEAARQAVEEVLAVLRGYGEHAAVTTGGAVHAVRQFRAALHGFVTLEAAGGFGLPESVDETFRGLVDALDLAFRASR